MRKHIHKYKRTDIGQKKPYLVFRCVLPGCTHYLPVDLITGKFCLCWGCNNEFVIKLSDKAMPKCDNCREIRGVDSNKISDILDTLESQANAEVGEIDSLVKTMELQRFNGHD